jgi:hypothetical protein
VLQPRCGPAAGTSRPGGCAPTTTTTFPRKAQDSPLTAAVTFAAATFAATFAAAAAAAAVGATRSAGHRANSGLRSLCAPPLLGGDGAPAPSVDGIHACATHGGSAAAPSPRRAPFRLGSPGTSGAGRTPA